jgi:phage protein D
MSESSLSQGVVYSAKPTIRVDGQANDLISDLLVAMKMTEAEGGLSALELRLSNVASDPQGSADLAFEDESVLKLGTAIAAYGGDEQSPREIFRGVVTGLEADFPETGPPELVIYAEDKLQSGRMTRKTALHDDVTLADLANQVAQSLSLTPVVTGFTDNIGTQVQLNESDLAFLRRLLAAHDGDVQVVGSELHVSPRGDVQRGTIELEMFSQLRRARVIADLAEQVTEVTATGWDPSRGERVKASSSGAHSGPGSGRRGSEQLQQTLGTRSEHMGQLALTTTAQAQAVADSTFDRRARRFVRVEASAEGNPALRVGTQVTLSGLSHRFDNTYYVVRAVHRFDLTKGYLTDFEAECAFLGDP